MDNSILVSGRPGGIPHLFSFVCHPSPEVGYQVLEEGLLTLRNFYNATGTCLPPPSNVTEKVDGALGVRFIYRQKPNGQMFFGIGYGDNEWFSSDEINGHMSPAAPESIRFHLMLLLKMHQDSPLLPRLEHPLNNFKHIATYVDIISGVKLGTEFQTTGFEITPNVTKFRQKTGNRIKRYGMLGHRVVVDGKVSRFRDLDTYHLPAWNIKSTEWTRNRYSFLINPDVVDEALSIVRMKRWTEAFDPIPAEQKERVRKHVIKSITNLSGIFDIGDIYKFPNLSPQTKMKELLFVAKVVREASRGLDDAVVCYDLPGWHRFIPEGIIIETKHGPVKVIDLNYSRIRYENHLRAKLAK